MLWIQTPTTWLRGPFHDVRETVNGNKTKQGNERKHQLRTTPNAQVMGEKYICLEDVLPRTFTYMVLIMRWNPSLGRVSLAAQLPGICCHGPCMLPAALGLVGRERAPGGGEGEKGPYPKSAIGNPPHVGSGTHTKGSFRQNQNRVS